jgi:hypothetical protein
LGLGGTFLKKIISFARQPLQHEEEKEGTVVASEDAVRDG